MNPKHEAEIGAAMRRYYEAELESARALTIYALTPKADLLQRHAEHQGIAFATRDVIAKLCEERAHEELRAAAVSAETAAIAARAEAERLAKAETSNP